MPRMIIVAGPNGAGKSTIAPALLQQCLGIKTFVNADVIAKGLNAYEPETQAVAAGRIMLNRLKQLIEQRVDFAFETTLATRVFSQWVPLLKSHGYSIGLTYMSLQSSDLAVARVKQRVALGGHVIPEDVIRRRYLASFANFTDLYQSVVDHWEIYDNSQCNQLALLEASVSNAELASDPAVLQAAVFAELKLHCLHGNEVYEWDQQQNIVTTTSFL